MNPIPVLRRAGRRLGSLFLALLAVCGLVTAGSAPAHAETSQRYTVIDWHMEGFDDTGYGGSEGADRANRYRQMVARLRAASGHEMAGANTPAMLDTPVRTDTNRVIEVRVWTNEYGGPSECHVKLYFSVDNLYLLGFTARGTHWQFADTTLPLAREIQNFYGMANPPLFTSLGYRGDYNSLDSNGVRGNFGYQAQTMQHSMLDLSYIIPARRDSYRGTLAYFIGATAEAARFGWIENRIAAAIDLGYDPSDPNRPAHLGNFGASLQTQWSALSRVAHQTVNGGDAAPVTVDGRTYTSITQIRFGNNAVPRIAPFLGLYRSGR
ncbi:MULTISPECIES: ribosome-inactivating family protein [Streptomyces]|uniref:Ribosome-inactivating family protein n=1 Tax=Streptomyces sudanensis TaxID=436397 RepID=A0ABY4TDN7_9ACTN|nr:MULTISPECIES: ribosome-inactivating family protein [Streptomyces]URN17059.1 ribosome-inactivating family protein [Streptomyces sudanensis]